MNIKPQESKFNNPISEGKIDEIINLLDVRSADVIIDFGGGKGEVLLKILGKNNAKGILVDTNEKLLESCRKKAGALIESGHLTLTNQDAQAYLKEMKPQSVDCVVCIGATYALGGYLKFIKAIMSVLKTGGLVLVGEEYWQKKPDSDYLSVLGGEESDLMYHHENIEEAEKLGLTYLYSHVASEDDWNRYEGVYFLEDELKNINTTDPDALKKLESQRNFRKAQFKYGRNTMGFGLYLFLRKH